MTAPNNNKINKQGGKQTFISMNPHILNIGQNTYLFPSRALELHVFDQEVNN